MLAAFLSAALAHPLFQAIAIVAATFVLEDATTIMVGALSADRTIPPGLALVALWIGIAAGDLWLYGMGHLAARYAWARRFVPPETERRVQTWLRARLVETVVAIRFIPGLRLPVYTACGFLGMPLGRFAAAVVGATLVWTTLLFGFAFEGNAWAAQRLGAWRWAISIGIALLVLAGGRLLRRRSKAA